MSFKALIFTCGITFLAAISFAQQNDGSIPWDSNRPLTWNDFKGRPNNSVSFHAQTNGDIGYEFIPVTENVEYKLILKVTFDQKKSWVKLNKATDYLLSHEQTHFDIFELHLRILVKRIEEKNILGKSNFNDKLNKVFEKTFQELIKFQEKYDRETNHSQNENKQKDWEVKVKGLLEEYKSYSKKEIIFKIK